MAEATIRGPAVALGMMLDNTWDPMDGPDIEYQGSSILDHRLSPSNKDSNGPGRYVGFFNNPYTVLCDNVPQTSTAAVVAAAQNVVSGTPMTLTTAQANGTTANVPCLAVGIPVVPTGGSAAVTSICFDYGFTTGTTTAGSATVTVPDSSMFVPGMWVYIAGAGNSGKTLPLAAVVGSLASATTITLLNASGTAQTALASVTHAGIGAANLPNITWAPGTNPMQHWPYLVAGAAAMLNPREALVRGIAILGSASSTGGNITVRGYDIYHNAMSETIAAPAGATTAYGKKAFKYITSVTPAFTDAHNYTVSASDVFGFNWRTDAWEYTQAFWASAFTASGVGYLPADTATATATTGDVRGTVQLSTAGGGTPITGGSASDNARRLTIQMSAQLWSLVNSNPTNTVSMFGRTQA